LTSSLPVYAIAGEHRLTNGDRNLLGLIIKDNLGLIGDFSTQGMVDSHEVGYGLVEHNGYLYYSGLFAKNGSTRDAMVTKVDISSMSSMIPILMSTYDGVPITTNQRDENVGSILVVDGMLATVGFTSEAVLPNVNDGLVMWLDPALGPSLPLQPLKTIYDDLGEAYFDVHYATPDRLICTGQIERDPGNSEIFITSIGTDGTPECCLEPYEFSYYEPTIEFHPTLYESKDEVNDDIFGLVDNYWDLRDACDELEVRNQEVFRQPDNVLKVYPNPSLGNFTIELENSVDLVTSWKIIDALGKEVQPESYETAPGRLSIDLSSFSSGIYTVHLITKEFGSYYVRVCLNQE
jgi:Secretion system C-terminal sorting domain